MSTQKTVLIAEDDYAISLAIKTIITQSFECGLVIAKDGEEAWQAVQNQHIDLVVSDWNMPLKTGEELLKEIRENDRLANLPFLMLTARSDKDSVLDAIDAGVTEYMHKPFDRQTLIDKISKLLDSPAADPMDEFLSLPEDESLQKG